MAINDWPSPERPREKLLNDGPNSLSDAELVAIFLRTGIRGKSAVDLARDLLNRFGSLNGLFSANQTAFCQLPGMGTAKYAQLQAVLEMARRALKEQLHQQDALTSSSAVRDYLKLRLRGLHREVFLGLFLDAQHRVISIEELFSGTLRQTSVYPREVLKRALYHNAASMIFAHNHPGGRAEPSDADQRLTQHLKAALAMVDVAVIDHFVISDDDAMSFMEHGLL